MHPQEKQRISPLLLRRAQRPRSVAIRSSTRRTRNPLSDVSTSIAGHSRVQSSTTVNMRTTLPVLTQSLTKSIDQRWFGLVAIGLLAAPVQRIRRRCRIRMINPSSRYSRYTRLWFAGIPSRCSLPSAVDNQTAFDSRPVLSASLATHCLAQSSVLDNDASNVPIPAACRRAVR